MSTCETCKHWDPFAREKEGRWDGEFDKAARWGTCGRQDVPNPPMYTMDASEYASWLRTKSTFSCSEYEAK